MVLFAFAGNMDVDEFAKRFPSAAKIGVGRLPGYNFIFNKTDDDQSSKANIIQSAEPNDDVWGILIALDDSERNKLYNNDFKLEHVNCIDGHGQIHPAEACVAQPHAINSHLLPFDWYIENIIHLAKLADLPQEYIEKLKLFPYKADPDKGQAKKRPNELN